uniref:Related to dehydrogenase n=1 Tax=Ramularia collo-cygni TaxID=112498 RepID=A0A2D3UQS1_9PEZI
MSLQNLPGVALITGAASGIGRGTAFAFAKSGCKRMLVGDVDENGLELTRKTILEDQPDVEVEVALVDISDEDSVQGFIDHCVSKFGRIDYACNIAGICPARESIAETSVETFDRVISINTLGTFLCHRAEIRQMLKQDPLPTSRFKGSIVSVSSMAGINASPGVTPYSSSKFAIIGQVKTDAMDYGPQGLRVNSVGPGFTNTERLRAMANEEQLSAIAGSVPLSQLGLPEQVGQSMAWLCSEEAGYVNGINMMVDGGATLWRQIS